MVYVYFCVLEAKDSPKSSMKTWKHYSYSNIYIYICIVLQLCSDVMSWFVQVTKCMIDDTAPRQVTLATSEVKQQVFICDAMSWNAGQGTCPAILGCEICLCPDQNGIQKDQKRDLWLCISLKQSLHIQSLVLSFARTCVCTRIKGHSNVTWAVAVMERYSWTHCCS